MRRIGIIARKEIRDNLRDKRSMFFALVYGSLLMPALILGPLIYSLQEAFTEGYEQPKKIHVIGEERAPNLIRHLHGRNIDADPAPENFREQLRNEELDIVLDIAEHYPERFSSGQPARVTLHYNRDNGSSQSLFWQIRAELESYSHSLAAQRLLVRGHNPEILETLELVESDVSREEVGAGMIATMLMFMVTLSMTMGGFYLAVDTTAGERERLSLEPLLSLAVSRLDIALGKCLAIIAFVFLAYIGPLISTSVLLPFIPEGFFGNAGRPTLTTLATLFTVNLPLVLMIGTFLMAVAVHAKSIKEAQTQLGFAMLVPMAPFFIIQFTNMDLDGQAQLIPLLSQYLLASELLIDGKLNWHNALPGMVTTSAAALVFFLISVRAYKRNLGLG
ncbi:ABC transporter permease [Marinimicrobium alkaliphilum]|uniref:ABC transporter permease n=1 Tax=Marinimicrobium alkaliphilum TaxID=2202654 RepID=UPI000DBA8DC9|nr:ABC transporter permease [Marinimicrobium alkaliphilum]